MFFPLRYWRIVLFALVVAFLFWSGYRLGIKTAEFRQLAALADFEAKQDELSAKLIEAQVALTTRTGEKVRTIYVEKDASGCLDTAIPDGVRKALDGSSRPIID